MNNYIMQPDTSRQLDERFFHSCQGLKSRSSFVRLASVFDLLHIADEWVALDPSSVTGRLQEIVDVLISFIHSGDPQQQGQDPTLRARIAAFEGLSARLSAPLQGEQAGIPTPASWDEFSTNYSWASLAPGPGVRNAQVRVNFSDINLRGVRVRGARLSGLMWMGACLDYAEFNNCVLDEGNFKGAYLDSTTFSGSLKWCTFSHAHVNALIVQQADMRGSDFTMCDLSMSLFEDSKLEECDFRGAILVAANLNGCSCDANTFDGATIDERTVFPDGSSLQEVGEAEICERWPGIIIKEAVF